ncbi:MAG: autotransporter-associated beta strand repeat-containing protein, partial [Sedimentisphaerales bacterium]
MTGVTGISFTSAGTSGYTIQGASLSFTSGATIGGNSTLAQTIATNIVTNGGGIVINSDTFNLTLSTGVISGTGGLTQSGAKTLTLSGSNTYTGATTINAGKVSIGADSGLGTAPVAATAGQITFGGGTLESSG